MEARLVRLLLKEAGQAGSSMPTVNKDPTPSSLR